MTIDEFKEHLKNNGELGETSKGLLAAFELGYTQGKNDKPYPSLVMFAVEQAIKNGSCYWEIEEAFDDFEASKLKQP